MMCLQRRREEGHRFRCALVSVSACCAIATRNALGVPGIPMFTCMMQLVEACKCFIRGSDRTDIRKEVYWSHIQAYTKGLAMYIFPGTGRYHLKHRYPVLAELIMAHPDSIRAHEIPTCNSSYTESRYYLTTTLRNRARFDDVEPPRDQTNSYCTRNERIPYNLVLKPRASLKTRLYGTSYQVRSLRAKQWRVYGHLHLSDLITRAHFNICETGRLTRWWAGMTSISLPTTYHLISNE
jgi:hypothetical protein